jgi:hypothetical protein
MPTPMEVLKMNLTGFRKIVDRSKPSEKITESFAQEINHLIAKARSAEPAMAERFPEPISIIRGRKLQLYDFGYLKTILDMIDDAIRGEKSHIP